MHRYRKFMSINRLIFIWLIQYDWLNKNSHNIFHCHSKLWVRGNLLLIIIAHRNTIHQEQRWMCCCRKCVPNLSLSIMVIIPNVVFYSRSREHPNVIAHFASVHAELELETKIETVNNGTFFRCFCRCWAIDTIKMLHTWINRLREAPTQTKKYCLSIPISA